MSWIDAHIHLDKYEPQQLENIIREAQYEQIKHLIAVSVDLQSSMFNYKLHKQFPSLIYPCYGYHPEQPLPTPEEEARLFTWIEERISDNETFAIGEVGLPYYQQQEAIEKGEVFDLEPYIQYLRRWFLFAQKWDKPIALHVIYDHVEIVLHLLNEIPLTSVHFHWYKGSNQATHELVRRGYMVSITPDALYEPYTKGLITQVPITQMMVETDGPWPYEEQFSNQLTTPKMVKKTCEVIAELKQLDVKVVVNQLYENSKKYYNID